MTRLTRAQQQQRTHERLLEAGGAVFARRGFLAATVEEIVVEAGYTRGALYKHFDGKEGLWLAITEARAEDHLLDLGTRLDLVSDRDELVAALVPGGPAFGEDVPRWSVATYEFSAWLAGQPDLAATVVATQRQREARIVELLDRTCARLGVRPSMPLPRVVVLIGALGGSLALRRAIDPAADVHAVAADTLAAVFPSA
ncbi:TetR/AcrR family transcriptional regulator [Amycolatopsis sp. 195334CR]|uniref:TetR/AcrR family transcriptional regulator n=1 Tax=Amycolatopsis sp. 195334CR TaxID=2814588 RepID=UPI001A902F0C|nr:TetR/AcrR family transcriptional regulator [Amycolatopsis sp. 195334CR]MBN6035650.1 TetR/AcrR family transcriptional regulator [Amycolatopsis sp. 195334CR]